MTVFQHIINSIINQQKQKTHTSNVVLFFSLISLLILSQLNWMHEHHYGEAGLRLSLALFFGLFFGVFFSYLKNKKYKNSSRFNSFYAIISVIILPVITLYFMSVVLYNIFPYALIPPIFYFLILVYLWINVKDDNKLKVRLLSSNGIYSFLFIFTLLFFSSVYFSETSRYLLFGNLIIQVTSITLVLTIPGYLLLRAYSKNHMNSDMLLLYCTPASIAVLLILFLPLQLVQAPSIIYQLASIATVIFLFRKAKSAHGLVVSGEPSVGARKAGILVMLATVISTSFILTGLSQETDLASWIIPARKSFHSLPVDNNLQFETARVFIKYTEPWSGSWGMGDRPPLQGVINAFMAHLASGKLEFSSYQMYSTFLNVLFLLPLFFIFRKLFQREQTALLSTLLAYLSYFIFLCSYFVWPKLFAVYFILLSIYTIWHWGNTRLSLAVAGALWSLGFLCHGGAILSLPPIMGIYFLYLIWKKRKNEIKNISIFLFVFVLIYSPWAVYKKLYPEINTGRLLTQYIPGEGDSFVEKIKDALEKHPIQEQLNLKFNNLYEFLFTRHEFPASVRSLFEGSIHEIYGYLNYGQFFYPISAVGEINILIAFFVIIISGLIYLLSDKKILPLGVNIQSVFFLFMAVFCSYLFNIMAKFRDTIDNHEISMIELVILTGLLPGIILSFSRIAGLFITILIVSRFAYVIIYSPLRHDNSAVDFFNVVIVSTVIAAFWIIFRKQEL